MPSTHTSLHYHLIFATKHRQPLIATEWQHELHCYLGGIVKGLDAHPEAIGGIADHVHLLVSLKPTACLADFMRELKKSSSAWTRDAKCPGFQWQEGYAAFTVSASARDAVRRYIVAQHEHHRTKSFREELVELLEKSGVTYDPRYLD
jgi:REP element-mobilizing transposase RayT